MIHTCPVCGYDHLSQPPERYMICPSCGTEFDNDDVETTHTELRHSWIAQGARWWSPSNPAPSGWSAADQLRRAGHSQDATVVQKLLEEQLRLKTPAG